MRLRRVPQRAAPEGEPRQPRARPRMLVPRRRKRGKPGPAPRAPRGALLAVPEAPALPSCPFPLPPACRLGACPARSMFWRSRRDGTFTRRLGRLSTPGRHRGCHQSLGPAIVIKTLQVSFQLEEGTEP